MKKILALVVLVFTVLAPFVSAAPFGQQGSTFATPSLADSTRVNELNELFKEHFRSNPDLARRYAEEALALAEEIGFEKGAFKLINNLGVLHSNQGNYDLALEYHYRNLAHYEEIGDMGRVANSLVNIGGVKFAQGAYESALLDYQRAFSHYFSIQDTSNAMHVLNNVGTIYQDQGRLGEALKQFLTVLDYRKQQRDSAFIIPALLNVGLLYQMRGQLEEAEGFFKEGLDISQATDDKYRSVAAMNSLAAVWSDLGRHPDAARLHKQAQQTAQEISDQFGLAEALIGRAREFSHLRQPDSASIFATEARLICKEIGRKSGESQALMILGEGLLMEGKPQPAVYNLREGIALADTMGHTGLLRQGWELLSEAYSRQGMYREAFMAQDSFIKFNEEINSKQNNELISELQAKYEAGQQEEAINALQLQTAENELKIARSRRRNTILIAGLLLLLAIAVAFLMRIQQKQRLARLVEEQRNEAEAQRSKVEAQNKQIREINSNLEKMIEVRTHAVRAAKEELDVFLYQSAHALRRPLLRIEGLLSLLEPKLSEPGDAVLVDKLGQTLKDMDSLLHQLVKVNEVQRHDPELEPVRFQDLLREVIGDLDWADVKLEVAVPEDALVVTDSFLLRTILQPIFQNALQYRVEGADGPSRVRVLLKMDEVHTMISVVDNGRGVPEGELENLFEMFFRADHQTRGNGLGLYVARQACEKLHGSVSAAAVPGGGLRITIELPPHSM